MSETEQQTTVQISSTKRIAKNTLMLYFRQILIMLVSLYTVRVVLATLGAEDYGVYNVVAGVVTMFGFLSGAMATASQRFFSFELGRGDTEKLKKTFSVTLCIYLLLILIIVILAETVGLWFVNCKLVIPAERMTAARWIYQFSILNFAVTLITAPYMAAIIAHEDMNVYAYVSIVEVALKLGVVFVLKILPYDKLIVYGILLFAVGFINTALYRTYCKRHYEECRFKPVWDGTMFGEISSYIGWNLFGAAVGIAKNQGINIILNQYFGAFVNAARAVALQVNAAVNSFSQNFSTAMRPQIIKSYAAGKKDEMLSLTFRGMRFTYFFMFALSMPLIFDMNIVLSLWLKNPPENAVLFTSLTLIDAIIESISYTLGTAIQAVGRIKWYQIIVGTFLIFNLPVSYIFLRLGYGSEIVFFVAIAITVIALIARLGFMRFLVGFKLTSGFVLSNFARMILCSAVSIAAVFAFRKFTSLHFILNMLIEYVFLALLLFFVGCTKSERSFVWGKICRKK